MNSTMLIEESTAIKPFTMFPSEILDNPDIDIYMQSVLLALYRFRDQINNTCFPSYEVLAQCAKCCVRKVKSIVKQLEEMGMIAVCRRGKGRKNAHASNVYILPGLIEASPNEGSKNLFEAPVNIFSMEGIPAVKQKQAEIMQADFQTKGGIEQDGIANDEIEKGEIEKSEISSALYAPPCAEDAHPYAPDTRPRAYPAPNKDLFNNNIYQDPSVNHSFFPDQNTELKERMSGIGQILDDHFEYDEQFSALDITTQTAYHSLRTYMTEMLIDEQTNISGGITEFREDIAKLLFASDYSTLLAFIPHVWQNRDRPIISPRAYLKKSLLEYIRAEAVSYQPYLDPDHPGGTMDKANARADLSLYRYGCVMNGTRAMLI